MTTSRRLPWVALIVTVLAALVVVGTPVWLIQPFASQTQSAVEWSWLFRRVAPTVTALAAVLTLVLAAAVWRRPTTAPARSRGMTTAALVARRSALVLLVAVAVGAAWFARQNHFEWMFRPFPDPRFVAAAEAADLAAEAPVIGVAMDGHALAFPITRIGYHHLVNTTLGDVPIVATY